MTEMSVDRITTEALMVVSGKRTNLTVADVYLLVLIYDNVRMAGVYNNEASIYVYIVIAFSNDSR